MNAAARAAARFALVEIGDSLAATRYGLTMTAAHCAARAWGHVETMRKENKRARAVAYRAEESRLRDAINGPRVFFVESFK